MFQRSRLKTEKGLIIKRDKETGNEHHLIKNKNKSGGFKT